MSNIWNKEEKIMELVAKHYNIELKASNTYFHLATVAKNLGYDNVSSFFIKMGRDKQEAHMPRLIDYLMKLDHVLRIGTISVPEIINVNSIKDVMDLAVSTEAKVRESVKQVAEVAFLARDFETFEMLQWFVKDSIEDLEEVSDLATYVNAPNVNMINIESITKSRFLKKK